MVVRKNTTKLLLLVENGLVDKDQLIQEVLNWMSEDEVTEFAEANDYLEED